MTADIIQMEENDMMMIRHNIYGLHPAEIDSYIDNLMKKLVYSFGEGKVILIPVREGNAWDFTIIRKPIAKKPIAKK